MKPSDPFHEGELTVQKRANEADIASMKAGVVTDRIPRGALTFIAQQPMLIAGTTAPDDSIWCSVLLGSPGFLEAHDDRTLFLDRRKAACSAADPFFDNIGNHSRIGLLVIELETRRRLRINGRVQSINDDNCVIDVEAAYPNCPKYIQRRRWSTRQILERIEPQTTVQGEDLGTDQIATVRAADTFFVASAHREHGMDASHRGGLPGFVKVLNSRTLLIPDYPGNSMFNTLGNFACYPWAGLAFIDFTNSTLLQICGRVEILWNAGDKIQVTGGTGRSWQLTISAWRKSQLPIPFNWELFDYSPYIPADTP